MPYLERTESATRIARVREMLQAKQLDIALVYYDEFNIGNGWYLTGWCPQFESGAVLIPRSGKPRILGGPESEPFAKLDSTITETRNFPVFMVPDEEYPNATIIDFPKLFEELNAELGTVQRVGLVGAGRMPAECYQQIVDGFKGVELVDMTNDYVQLRYDKSPWEREQIRAAFALADAAYDAMKEAVQPGNSEIQVAAAGEYAARSRGASGFGFSVIVGSGQRSNAVVPTASSKKLQPDELVMIGIAPKVRGYVGVVGDALPVDGQYSARQQECMKYLKEAFRLTKSQLVPGKIGREIDAPARAYFEKNGLSKYLVCPFVHTIGLHEAEAPFFGPNSDDVLEPGMTVCVDVSFFGHPEFRAYPRTEQNVTSCVGKGRHGSSSHGGKNALRLEWSVCADAGKNVAAIGTAVAQVSTESEGRSSSGKSARCRGWDILPVPRPKSTGRRRQHLCLDKGYCGKSTETLARRLRYVLHVPRKGEVQAARRPGQRARRWVVEGSHSWTNRARRLLVRWEKKVCNYLAFIHLQFAYIALKQAGVLG